MYSKMKPRPAGGLKPLPLRKKKKVVIPKPYKPLGIKVEFLEQY